MSQFWGEMIGTMILILFGGGVVAGNVLKSSKGEGGGWAVVTIAWGLGVAMGAYAVGNISGAHLNPALTIAFASIGGFSWADVPVYILAQMVGAIIGALLVYLVYLPHWKETEDADLKLGVFSTSPAIRHSLSNLIAEVIGTFVLVLGIFAIGANEFTEGLNPIIIGTLIMAIGMSLGGPTGYAINPARDLGPRIAHFLLPIPGKRDSDWSYAWIPVVGPVIGGVFGALFYKQFFLSENSMAFWFCLIVVLAIFIAAQISMSKKKVGDSI